MGAFTSMTNTLKLHMGFINTPYTQEAMQRPATSAKLEERRVRNRGFSRTMTAQKVASILEGKYGIVETFQKIYDEEINNIIHEGFKEIAEKTILERKGQTRTSLKNLMKPSTKQIEGMFKSFLRAEEMNGMAPGVPTKASFGKQRKRGRSIKPHSSFVRTGIYMSSFRAWID
jgi:hypothetical protein